MKKMKAGRVPAKLYKPAASVFLALMFMICSVSVCACSAADTGTNADVIPKPSFGTDAPAASPETSPETSPEADEHTATDRPELSFTPEPVSDAERILSGMTLREKIGQLFFILPESLRASCSGKADFLTSEMKKALKEYPAGGILLASNNISSPGKLKRFTDDLQEVSSVPLFIGMDEEGGNIVRIADCKNFHVPAFPPMLEIGKTGNPSNAYRVGFTIGGYLQEYGVNLDLAPVADLFTNPENRVIGSRCFGNDPEIVSSMVSAEIRGFHAQGIMACAKHFPGHGNTKGDTHFGFVKTDKTWEELLKLELIPFQAAIDSHCDMIMAAHIAAPGITGNDLPATLSYTLITEKLRNEMGFDGVVISDAMAMQAITDLYSSEEAAVKAIQAGVDIILSPDDYEEAFEGLYKAVKSGIISEDRINESVLRILELKEKYIIPDSSDSARDDTFVYKSDLSETCLLRPV